MPGNLSARAAPATPAPASAPAPAGRLGWYSELGRTERSTYWACLGGLALDSVDTTMFALVMPTLMLTIGITKPEAGLLGSAVPIGSAVGGWLGGILADRHGRVRVLQVTILIVALFTALSAFTSSFWQLLVVRSMQGIGYGGEAAVGGVLISEIVAPRVRGRVAASVQSGYAIGYAISTGLMPIVFWLFPETMAWRVFFLLGLAPAVLVFFIRRLVPESPLFVEDRRARRHGAREGFWTIFVPPHLRNTAVATALSIGIFGAAYTMITWLPTYLRTVLKLQVAGTAGYLALNILGSFTGPFLYGYLSDRIGRRRSFMLFLLLQAVNVALYLLVPIDRPTTFVLGYFLGALQAGLASGMLPAFSELFPTRIRASGQGFTLSGGRGLGAVVPAVVGLLAARMPLGTAMGASALCAYGAAFAAALLLPETSGVDLRSDGPPPPAARAT